MSLSKRARDFITPVRYATLATINPDGSPHQTVVWYLLRDDRLVVNSLAGRRWPANLRRDPRLSLVIEQGWDYVAIVGEATEDPDPGRAQADIAELARRYEDPGEAERLIEQRFRPQRRVSFHVRIVRVHEHWDDK